jgi:hypothetical protein
MHKENLGNKFDIVSIFKPNAPLAKVVEDLGKLGKGLTKQDNIVIMGGPDNSLDRNHYYSVKRMSTSLQRGQPSQMWDLSTSSAGMTSHG